MTGEGIVVVAAAPVFPIETAPVEEFPIVTVPEVVPGVIVKFPVVPLTATESPPVPDLKSVVEAAVLSPKLVVPPGLDATVKFALEVKQVLN